MLGSAVDLKLDTLFSHIKLCPVEGAVQNASHTMFAPSPYGVKDGNEERFGNLSNLTVSDLIIEN